MELTPDLLLEAKFAPSRRGYDMNEVDDFLERCAEGLDVLLNRLRIEYERAERAEAMVAELQAQIASGVAPMPRDAVVEPEPRIETEAELAEPEVPAPAAPSVPAAPTTDRAEESMRVLLAAERTAEAAVAEARAEADSIRAEARTLLDEARITAEAEARRAGEAARAELESQVVALRDTRDTLGSDIRALETWLGGQRDRILDVAEELRRIADDPEAFSPPAPHSPTGAPVGEATPPPASVASDDFGVLGRFLHSDDDSTRAVPVVEPGRDDDSSV